jgi:predicted ATPase
MARLDRLGGPAKEVAQMAAAIGREFSHALLNAVMRKRDVELGSALDRLIAAGLLFRQGLPPHATYLFKHALVRDAAYGTLLREQRRVLHARIADTLEVQFADIAESRPELLARHWTEAGLIEKAASLWGKAGQRSLARSALVEAAEQLTRALDQIATLPGTPVVRGEQIKLQVALVNALMHVKGYAAPEPKAAVEQARQFIERAEANARRTSRRSTAALLGPLWRLGSKLCGVQRRRDARACVAIYGARREATADRSTHDRASPHG